MSDESSMKWYHKIIKESFSFAIALVLLIPFMIYFGVVLIYLQDTVLLEKMTALLGGLVAVVIGYYFGQRPVRELTTQVKAAQEEKEKTRGRYVKATTDFMDWSELFEDIKRDMESIKKLKEGSIT